MCNWPRPHFQDFSEQPSSYQTDQSIDHVVSADCDPLSVMLGMAEQVLVDSYEASECLVSQQTDNLSECDMSNLEHAPA